MTASQRTTSVFLTSSQAVCFISKT